MSEKLIRSEKFVNLSVINTQDHDSILKLGKALSCQDRLKILKSLLASPKHLTDLSEELKIPISSVSRHIDALSEAGLVFISYQPGIKGHTKFCAHQMKGFTVLLENDDTLTDEYNDYQVELPIGMFSHCHIKPPCGMNSKTSTIELFDDPRIFFLPTRIQAECLWFDYGFISYSFPSPPKTKEPFNEISFSFEACSEAIGYNNDWPSDITISINDIEICTFTLPGDFGGRRGRFTPKYWPTTSTQFGVLKEIKVNNKGVYIDNFQVSTSLFFNNLNIYKGNAIKLTISVKEDAEHRGGINIFGKNFGDYQQSLVMTLRKI